MKEKFLEVYKSIQREGSAELMQFLEKSDFFAAPASTKYHGAYEGGLCQHSLNVYNRLKEIVAASGQNYSEETVAIVSLLHDVCKVNFYKQELRNVKEGDQWVQKPFYTIEDNLPYGHGEKSVYMISGFMKLTREEAFAIRWHMGGFDESVKGGSFSLSKAWEKYPLGMLLHCADLQATYLDERKN